MQLEFRSFPGVFKRFQWCCRDFQWVSGVFQGILRGVTRGFTGILGLQGCPRVFQAIKGFQWCSRASQRDSKVFQGFKGYSGVVSGVFKAVRGIYNSKNSSIKCSTIGEPPSNRTQSTSESEPSHFTCFPNFHPRSHNPPHFPRPICDLLHFDIQLDDCSLITFGNLFIARALINSTF